MMKYVAFAAVLAFGLGSVAMAEELKSGPQPGQQVKFFLVEKIAGAEDDGVKIGKKLCYRCANIRDGKPQVIVFSREVGEGFDKLVSNLNGLIAEQEGDKLRAFVNILDDDREEAAETAKKTAESNKLSKVPVVVPNEFENGPGDYGLNAKANVTVIVAKKGGIVVSSHALESLDVKTAEAIVADVKKQLVD